MKSGHKWISLLLAAVLAPALAAVYLGLRYMEKESQLAARRASDQMALIAEQTVVRHRAALDRERLHLGEPSEAGILRFSFSAPNPPVAPPEFRSADQLEFAQARYADAAAYYRNASRTEDASTRAAALFGLARNLRKAGSEEAALAVYDTLTRMQGTLDGAPVPVVALGARCSLLAAAGRPRALEREAERLQSFLAQCAWPMDRPTYEHYSRKVAQWRGAAAPDPPAKFAYDLYGRWERQTLPAKGVELCHGPAGPVLVLCQNVEGMLQGAVLSPEAVRERFFDGLHRTSVYLTTAAGEPLWGAGSRPATAHRRPAAETGLPWNIAISPEGEDRPTASGFLQLGMAALLLSSGLAAALLIRVHLRERAVAQLQSNFVAAVSHEFRTPLTTLRQYHDLLADAQTSPEERGTFLAAQSRAIHRLQRLVESLLDFGRMESGVRPYRRAPLLPAAVARGVTDDFRTELPPGLARITFTDHCEGARAEGDAEALALALWNLLDNAAKYGGTPAAIDVTASREGPHIRLAVRDRGPGIPAAERSLIFRQFFRGEDARRRGIKGTGIGLALVHHIAIAHNGELRLEQAESGSVFALLLPVLEDQ